MGIVFVGIDLAKNVFADMPRPQAADHGVRGAFDEGFGLFRAIRIVARVRAIDATRPVPEVPSVALVAGCGRGDAREIEMSG
jgi:hypothetical protein